MVATELFLCYNLFVAIKNTHMDCLRVFHDAGMADCTKGNMRKKETMEVET